MTAVFTSIGTALPVMRYNSLGTLHEVQTYFLFHKKKHTLYSMDHGRAILWECNSGYTKCRQQKGNSELPDKVEGGSNEIW